MNYYEKVGAEEDERYQIEVVYCPNPEDFEECSTLTYDEFNQTDGLNSAENFENWIDYGMDEYLGFYSLSSEDIK